MEGEARGVVFPGYSRVPGTVTKPTPCKIIVSYSRVNVEISWPIHSSSIGESNLDAYRNWSPLTEEGYAEKLRLLREASSIPMERWRAPTVVAWLEVALGMPQYSARCTENIKSGKVNIVYSIVRVSTGM